MGFNGEDGGRGEDCGVVRIFNSLTVYAYGGGGGSSISLNERLSSGLGGGGYPAAGIGGRWGWSAVVVRLDVAGGGYTGGCAEMNTISNYNGRRGEGTTCGGGDGYFEAGVWVSNVTGEYLVVTPDSCGQGGKAPIYFSTYPRCESGDGGVAGKGGFVECSRESTVYAYNGDQITNEDYSSINYSERIKMQSGKTSAPLKIFAQEGILRAVYKYNSWWNIQDGRNYGYLKELLGDKINETIKYEQTPTTSDDIKNLKVRDECSCDKSGYVNPITHKSQGIGSGAGYIEISNGSFTEID